MNKYELCFHAWHGEPGKYKHKKTHYCKEGYHYNAQTDKRLDIPRCPDWYGTWNVGGCCSELKPRKVSGGWVPRRKRLI